MIKTRKETTAKNYTVLIIVSVTKKTSRRVASDVAPARWPSNGMEDVRRQSTISKKAGSVAVEPKSGQVGEATV